MSLLGPGGRTIIEGMGEGAAAAGVDRGEPSLEQRKSPRVIAVDGSAASGKSSIGRVLAAKLGYPFLDTGIMYRAVTWAALERRIALDDHEALTHLAESIAIEIRLPKAGSTGPAAIMVDGKDITSRLRQPSVEEAVSLVSRVAGVRDALVRLQRHIAGHQAIVMAGRDIGTVVLPGADLKVYLDASIEERARRRHQEFAAAGRDVTHEMVLEDLQRRDRIDSQRAVSPLRPAGDAVVINTEGIGQDEVLRRVLALVQERR